MKFTPTAFSPFRILSATVFSALALTAGFAEEAATFRRFELRGKPGQPFYAVVQSKTGTTVTFKLQSGKSQTVRIPELSEPDQQFVLKWTKFKDQLMSDAEFAKTTVRDLLELRGYQSFEFEIRGNHIFVDSEVNGKKATLMIDTGAQSTLLHDGFAKEAGVEMGPYDQKIHGIGGKAPAAVAVVKSVKLGDSEITNWKMLAADLFKDIPGASKDHDGILGADFLRSMDAVISYREGRMFLKPDKLASVKDSGKPGTDSSAAGKVAVRGEFRKWTSADGSKVFTGALVNKTETDATFRLQNNTPVTLPLDKLSEADRDIVGKWSKLRDDLAKNPEFKTLTIKELLELRNYQSFAYRLNGNHILVGGTVGTTKATFLIDSGAGGGVFHVDFAKKAGMDVGPMDQIIHGIGGTAPAAITKVSRLQMGDAVIENRVLLSADLYKASGGVKGSFDAIFGADFLRELDAVIAYNEGRMFLKPDNADKAENTGTPDASPKWEDPKKDAKPEEKKEAPKSTPKPA